MLFFHRGPNPQPTSIRGGQNPYFSTKSQYFHCSFCPGGGPNPIANFDGGPWPDLPPPPWIRHCKQLQSENKLVGNGSLRVKKWGNVVPRPTTPLPISQRFSTFCDSRTTYKFCFSVADHH